MNPKIGDKIYCKKTCFNSYDKSILFQKGNYYTIKKIDNDRYYHVEPENRHKWSKGDVVGFFISKGSQPNLWEFFANEKELRMMKLEKLKI